MAATTRQLHALGLLWWRSWNRRAVKVGAGPKRTGASGFVVLAWMALSTPGFYTMFAEGRKAGPTAVAWQIAGLVLFSAGMLATHLSPMGKARPALRSPLLDALPLTATARVAMALATNFLGIYLCVLAGIAWRGTAAGGLTGLLLYAAAASSGYAVIQLLRSLAAPAWRRRIAGTMLLLGFAGPFLVLAAWLLARVVTPSTIWLARAAIGLDGGAVTHAILAGALAGALALVAIVERLGWDHLDAPPPTVRGPRGRLDLGRAERRLVWRDGGRGAVLGSLLFVGALGLLVAATLRIDDALAVTALAIYGGFVLAYVGMLVILPATAKAVRRDVAARAFLSALPIAPAQTIGVKVRAIRVLATPLLLVTAALTAVVLAKAPHIGAPAVSAAARLVVVAIAIWLFVEAAVAVGFLTNGLGQRGLGASGGGARAPTLLILLPLFSASLAANVWSAVTATLTLAAITFEARRAARRSVEWSEDPADDGEHATATWRAVLVVGAFYAAQTLGGGAAGIFLGGTLPVGIGYLAGALVLVFATRTGRPVLMPPLRLLPRNLAALPAGIAGGLASGAAALAFSAVVSRVLDLTPGPAPTIFLVVAIVAAAPLAEELFFRGWLQQAIRADLPERRRHLAILLGALAFALAHVGSLVVPQLALGLVAGALYAWTGALLPGILAHAAHNALVLLLP